MTTAEVRICFCMAAAMMSLVQLSAAEYHYKFRGPPRPPAPPLPPTLSIHRPVKHPTGFYKNKLAGSRIVSAPLRGPPPFLFEHHYHPQQQQQHRQHPQQHQHYAPHFHSLPHSSSNVHVGRPSAHQPQPLLLSNGGGGGGGFADTFKSPVVNEHFPSVQLSGFEFHTTAKPLLHDVQFHHLSADDDKGPIHTIPAPNLSLLDRPHASAASFSSGNLEAFPGHGAPTSAHLQEPHNLGFPQQPLLGAFGGSGVTIQPSLSYQVREETNDHAGHTPDGKPVYFAPDPDPHLPAPKIPPTNDPHSVPSNGRSPVELLVHHLQSQGTPLQIFETNTNVMHDGQSLSSQDLYRLLQGSLPQQQQLMDTYPLPILQQPQLQQHILQQQHAFYQQHGELVDNSLAPRPGRDDFHPQLHTFNYEERASDQAHFSSQPHYSAQLVGDLGDEDVAASEPEPKVARTTSESAQGERNNDVNNNAPDGDADTRNEVEAGQDGGASSSFYSKVAQGAQLYTTLPNREAAETLATLAAAGNINSDFLSKLAARQEVDDGAAAGEGSEEYREEEDDDGEDDEEDDQYEEEHPSSTAAPPTTLPARRMPQTYLQQRQRYQQTRSHYQVRQEDNPRPQVDDEAAFNEDTSADLQFGARIRPKRDGVAAGD